jgi:hypothetical protein
MYISLLYGKARGASILRQPEAEPDERGDEYDEEVGRDHAASVRARVAQGMSQ